MINATSWLAGLLACSPTSSVDSEPQDSPTDTADTADSSAPVDTGPFDTTGLNGDEVDPRLDAPLFEQVVASDGSARTQADLMGHPTVFWFYPSAGTYG